MAANRKKGDYSVLAEINNEEEWMALCSRKGLTVVDVYSDWSGPCSAMTNFLKKFKLEVNDDMLSYAMARSDTIPQLEMFRGQCKPVWLFLASGCPVALLHGANAPQLQKMIEREMKQERLALKGETTRKSIDLLDAAQSKASGGGPIGPVSRHNLYADTDEEDGYGSGDNAAKKGCDDDDDDEEGRRPQQDFVRTADVAAQQASNNFAILLVEKFIHDSKPDLAHLKQLLSANGFEILQDIEIQQTSAEDVESFCSGYQMDKDKQEETMSKLLDSHCHVYLLRCEEDARAVDKLDVLLGPIDTDSSNSGSEDSAEKKASATWRQHFCRPNDVEKNLGFLVPDHAGFLSLMEKYFLEVLSSDFMDESFRLLMERKIMLLFPEEQTDYVLQELGNVKADILGKTTLSSMGDEKATLIMKNGKNQGRTSEETEEALAELSGSPLLAVVLKREVDRELRRLQNEYINELTPLSVTCHLPSIKLFFPTVQVKKFGNDGKVIGEVDQGNSSEEELDERTAGDGDQDLTQEPATESPQDGAGDGVVSNQGPAEDEEDEVGSESGENEASKD